MIFAHNVLDVSYALWLTRGMPTNTDAETTRAALAAAHLTEVVEVKASEVEVSVVATGQSLREMGMNADSAEIALREAGVPVKRFSVSSMYVMVDPAKRQDILDSPMPERAW